MHTGAIEVVRGAVVESRHQVHVAVLDADRGMVARFGDADRQTFYRSAAKPLQALPLVEEGVVERLGLTEAELALCCASHEGEPEHVAGARSILAKAGVDESALRCGAHAPFSAEATASLASAGQQPGRIHNNCSGKHAGMIALATVMGWDPEDYHREQHPVQRRMLEEVARWSGRSEAEIPTAVDGCGVLCFAVPLVDMALSAARFGAEAAAGGQAARIVNAMTSHPFMVAGTGRTCTDVMRVAAGRVFAKVGAEGVYLAGVPSRGLGIALKVEDGGRRGAEVALVRVLTELDVLSDEDAEALAAHASPRVTNTLGEDVGEIRAAFSLESHRA